MQTSNSTNTMHKGRLAQEWTNPFTRKWLSHTHHNRNHLSHLFKKHITTVYNPTYTSAVRSCQDAPSPCFQWPKHQEPYDEPRAFWFLFCTCHKFRKQYPEASHFVSRQMPLVLELLAIIKRKYHHISCIIGKGTCKKLANPQHWALSVQEL